MRPVQLGEVVFRAGLLQRRERAAGARLSDAHRSVSVATVVAWVRPEGEPFFVLVGT